MGNGSETFKKKKAFYCNTDGIMQYSFGSNGERKNVKQLYL